MVSSRTIAISGALAAALLLSGGAATGVRAQGFYGGPRPVYVYEPEPMIPPRAVAYRLMDRGFSEVGRPRFDGRAYVVDATNPAGDRMRLYVDARDGAVIGRERLGQPYYPSARPARAPAGYGWTEEDGPGALRGGYREAERLVPPADIPDAAPVRPRPVRPQDRAELQAPMSPRPGAPDATPLGMNPDAGGRPDAVARRAAKPGGAKSGEAKSGEARPSQAKVVPAAPKPALAPTETARPEPTGPETAAVEPPKVSEKPGAPMTPASVQPPAGEATAAEAPRARAEGAKGGWQDPPSGEARKNVRVIGGATVVPGAGETSGANSN